MCGVSGAVSPSYKGRVRAVPVLLTIVAGQTSYTLPDLSQFKDPYCIVGLSHRKYASGRKTYTGLQIIDDATVNGMWLNLKKGATDLFMQIPLSNIINDATSGYRDVYWIQPTRFDFSNSSITISDASVVTAGQSIELIVYTTDPGCEDDDCLKNGSWGPNYPNQQSR